MIGGRRRSGTGGEALAKRACGFLAQELLGAHTGGHRVLRQAHLSQVELQAAAARDLHRVRQCLGHIGKQRGHLRRTAQVLLAGVAAHPRRIGEQRAVVDADPRLVRFELLGAQEAHVVGRHDRHCAPRGEPQRAGDVGFLEGPAEALQLEVEALGEQLLPARQRRVRLRLVAVDQGAADLAFERARQRDQSVDARPGEPLAPHARNAAFLPFEPGAADEPRQVAVAVVVLAQQRQACRLAPLAVLTHQQIDPHDRLDAALERLAIELHHREQVVVVGHRDGRHAGSSHGSDQLGHAHYAVNEGELGVHPQVDAGRGERGRHRQVRRIGAKERRCSGEGRRLRSALKCAGVP